MNSIVQLRNLLTRESELRIIQNSQICKCQASGPYVSGNAWHFKQLKSKANHRAGDVLFYDCFCSHSGSSNTSQTLGLRSIENGGKGNESVNANAMRACLAVASLLRSAGVFVRWWSNEIGAPAVN